MRLCIDESRRKYIPIVAINDLLYSYRTLLSLTGLSDGATNHPL